MVAARFAALRAVWTARHGVHRLHAHHLVGSLAMVYMAVAMAYGGFSLPGSAWPTPATCQASIHRGSTSDGSNRVRLCSRWRGEC